MNQTFFKDNNCSLSICKGIHHLWVECGKYPFSLTSAQVNGLLTDGLSLELKQYNQVVSIKYNAISNALEICIKGKVNYTILDALQPLGKYAQYLVDLDTNKEDLFPRQGNIMLYNINYLLAKREEIYLESRHC